MEVYLDDSHEFGNGDSYAIVSSQEHLVGTNDGESTPEEDPVPHIFADTSEKSCMDFKWLEWAHLSFAVLNGFAYLALALFLMYKYLVDSDFYVFSILILTKFVFANYFLFHGMFREQPCQILMEVFTVLNLWILDLIYNTNISFSIEEVRNEHMKDIATIEMIFFFVRSGVALMTLVTGFILSWKYYSMEQLMFRTVGIDMNRVFAFRTLFLGFSLMIFDMETSFTTLVLFIRNGLTQIVLHEIVVLTVGIFFIVVWIFLGYQAVRKESRALTWTFVVTSLIHPAYIICLFVRNVKWTADSDPVLTLSSHVISLIALITHLSLIAVVITIHHYYGAGYGDVLVNGVHVSVKNSAEYEELRRMLFHPINPARRKRRRTLDQLHRSGSIPHPSHAVY